MVPGIYAVHWKFSMCTATRTSSYSPVKPSVFFKYILSLGLCFACLFVLFDLFFFICFFFYICLCPHSFVFHWALESSPLQFLALA